MKFEQERRALKDGLLFTEADELGVIAVAGADRRSWLNAMATCDLSKLAPGAGAYGLCTGKNGKILAEFWLTQDKDRLLLGVHKTRVAGLLEHFERYIMMEDTEVADASDTLRVIFLYGPRHSEALKAAQAFKGAVAGAVITSSDLGMAVLMIEAGQVDNVRESLARTMGERFCVPGKEAWEAIRIEAGIPIFGVDFDEQNYPQEASLERYAVSFQKGCYLGQEAVFMLEARGHAKKRLVKIQVEGEGSAEELKAGALLGVEQEGGGVEEVGALTSVVDTEGGAAALGYVKYKHARTGVELKVGGRKARIAYAPPMKE